MQSLPFFRAPENVKQGCFAHSPHVRVKYILKLILQNILITLQQLDRNLLKSTLHPVLFELLDLMRFDSVIALYIG